MPFALALVLGGLLGLLACYYYYYRRADRQARLHALVGRPVLILGGANGVGLALAERLCALHARVAVVDVADTAARPLPGCAYVQCDVAERSQVAAMHAQVVKLIGHPNVVINCVGICHGKALLDASDDDIERTVRVNLLSHVWTARAVVPDMIRRNDGHLVTFGSSMGFVGTTQLADYCATKAALYSFNEALRVELRTAGVTNVHTTIVCTGLVTTGMFEGIRLRFPWLTPPLAPAHVAERVITAIVNRNEPEIWAPLFVRGIPVLRLLPTWTYDLLQDIIGVSTSMKSFVGRRPRQA